ncbi:type IV secretion system protein, partial [Cupriavidus sp. CP313]
MIAVFQKLFDSFDESVLGTITTGSANIISLISPLMAVFFSIYVMLVMTSYWRGSTDTPIMDFFMRMASWAIIITAGMNVGYYSTYVVPFFKGIGEDIAKALVGDHSTANALDTLLSAYIDAAVMVMNQVFEAALLHNPWCRAASRMTFTHNSHGGAPVNFAW